MARLALALGTVLAVACGPTAYITGVSQRASNAVDAARAAQADKYAPYWYTRAVEYFHKAREVAAHADFQGATTFGRLAAEAGEKATAEAKSAAEDPGKRPLVQHPGYAPAKDDTEAAPAQPLVAPAKDAP